MITLDKRLTRLPNSRISQSLLRFLIVLPLSKEVLLTLISYLKVLIVRANNFYIILS